MLVPMIRRAGSRLLAVLTVGFLLGLGLGMVRGRPAAEPPPMVEPVDGPASGDDAPCPRAVTGGASAGCAEDDGGPVFFV